MKLPVFPVYSNRLAMQMQQNYTNEAAKILIKCQVNELQITKMISSLPKSDGKIKK